jgi:GTP cyclohydrolase FolE2
LGTIFVAGHNERSHGKIKVASNVGHVLDVVDPLVHCGEDNNGSLVSTMLRGRKGVDEEEGGLGEAGHYGAV